MKLRVVPFAENLKLIRISMGCTQVQMAVKLCCSASYLSRVERGISKPAVWMKKMLDWIDLNEQRADWVQCDTRGRVVSRAFDGSP